jgi:hypothetical protein
MLVIQARVSPLRTEKLARSRADPDQRVEYVTRDQSQNLTQRMVRHDKVGLGLSDLTRSPIQITNWDTGAPAWSAYVPRFAETPACFPHREWNQDFYEFHPLSYAPAGAGHSKSRFACTRFRVPRQPAFQGAKKRCAAQAEYGRLAAQA